MWRKTRRQKIWIGAFLGATGVAIVAELVAAFDPSGDTIPWTDLIVEYVPAEVAAAVFGALLLWLPVHFGLRYYMKAKGIDWRAGARRKRGEDG